MEAFAFVLPFYSCCFDDLEHQFYLNVTLCVPMYMGEEG